MALPIQTELPGLYVLPLPTPFPIGRVNVYVAQGDALTLIDTGVKSDKAYTELVEGLAALGVSPADLDRILITHHHTDHIGMTGRLVAESGAAVFCHSRGTRYLLDPVAAHERLCQWSIDVWREGGAPQGLLDITGQMFRWFQSLTTDPVAGVQTLEDGDTFALLGRAWTVLHTPGHAGDLICLHDAADAVLLASDHLLRDVSSNALVEPPEPGEPRPRRLLEYMAQLERVAGLAPRIAYGGHGKPTTDVSELVGQRLAFHRQRADKLLTLFNGEARTLYEMTELMFSHVSEPEKFLALSEVLGHLDWLEEEGRIVRVEAEPPLVRWRAV